MIQINDENFTEAARVVIHFNKHAARDHTVKSLKRFMKEKTLGSDETVEAWAAYGFYITIQDQGGNYREAWAYIEPSIIAKELAP